MWFFFPPRGEYKHLHHYLFGEAINRFDEQTYEETEDNTCTLSQFSFVLKAKRHMCMCYVVYTSDSRRDNGAEHHAVVNGYVLQLNTH